MSSVEPVPTLREQQREVTRDLILNAVARLLREGRLSEFTFADVAKLAGVSERTVYRHFLTRDELLQTFWGRMQAQLSTARARTGTEDPIWEGPLTAFPYLDRHEALLRAVIVSPQAEEARKSLSAARRPTIERKVREAVGDLPEPLFTYVCAIVQLLNAPVAWQALKDDYGLTGAQAGRAAAMAIKALVDAVKEQGAPLTFEGTSGESSRGENEDDLSRIHRDSAA
jgi:AcrR family transcriptional regulator